MNFISDLRQVGCFLRVLRFPPTNKTDDHDITEIVLKVALNTIKQTETKFRKNQKQRSSLHSHRDVFYDEMCRLLFNVKLVALQSNTIYISDDVRVV